MKIENLLFLFLLIFMLLLLGISSAARSETVCCELKKPTPTKTVYINRTVEKPVGAPVNVTSSTSAAATTGQQTQSIVIQQAPQKPVVVKLKRTVIKHRTKTKHIRINHYKNNRLLLLGGATKTRLDIDFDCCNLDIKRRYEPDFGLQYTRDFGTLSASIAATSNRSMYLGLGFNW
jgi:hypothetical protein